MLELQHIHKFFNPGSVNEICLFDDFNLTVKDGEFVSVVGSNGSGKTSMLNIICGSIDIDHGQILIDGKDYAGKRILSEADRSAVYFRILPKERVHR